MKSNYKVASLFSGCGGLDLGFINSGFKVIWANDFFKEAVETYKKNIGDHIVYGDITKIPSSDIPNDFDILLGGFPCQGFSVANTKRSMKDERNFLYKELLRLIKDKRPLFFVGENVKGLLSMQSGRVIEMIVEDFKSLGYKVDYRLLKASDYGVPQNRERVVIIGNRLGLENPFPKITHGLKNDLFNASIKPYVAVKDVISHLSNVRTRDKEFNLNNKIIHNHVARTNVADTFWGRKHIVNQHEICDYLKYWRQKSGWTTKKVDEYFGYAHTAGHWFRKDNNSGSIPNPKDWWELKKILGFDSKYDKAVTELELKEIKFEPKDYGKTFYNLATKNDNELSEIDTAEVTNTSKISFSKSQRRNFKNNSTINGLNVENNILKQRIKLLESAVSSTLNLNAVECNV